MTGPTLMRQLGEILSRLEVARRAAVTDGHLGVATELQRASVATRVALLGVSRKPTGEYRFPGEAEQESVERIEPIEEPGGDEDQ